MARLIYGKLVELTDQAVRYCFAEDQDEHWDGALVIPRADPEAWYVDGAEERSSSAAAIVAKARRAFDRTGEWPEGVAFQS